MPWLVKHQVIYNFNGKNKITIDRKDWNNKTDLHTYRITIYSRQKWLWFSYWSKKQQITFQTTDANNAIERAIELASNFI